MLACVAIGAAYVHGRVHSGDSAVRNAVHVQFAYSSNLDEMMAELIPQFNDAGVESNGRPVVVDGISASSGDVQAKIVRGQLRPDAWSPASSLWGRLLNQAADRKYVADTNPSLASSPVVISTVALRPVLRMIHVAPEVVIGICDRA